MSTDPTYQTAGDRIGQIFSDLDDAGIEFPGEVQHTATILARVVGDPDVEWSRGKRPGGIATSCIYVADFAVRGENRLTQTKLCKHAPATPPTVREQYRVIPGIFIDNVDQEMLHRVPDNIKARLNMFRAAVDSGVGITNVDPDANDYTDFQYLANAVLDVQETA